VKLASKEFVPGVQGIGVPEDYSIDHHPMAQDGDALGGVQVHGAFEGDDPATWETHALGGEPEADGEGDRSLGPNAWWESEGPIGAMTRGNE
jgi:hypothetical protein